jgi:hypothetical protein
MLDEQAVSQFSCWCVCWVQRAIEGTVILWDLIAEAVLSVSPADDEDRPDPISGKKETPMLVVCCC